MLITKAQQRDLPEILKLQHLAFLSEAELVGDRNIPPLTQTVVELAEEYRQGVMLKAVEADRIVGSVRAHLEQDAGRRESTLHIGKLMVHPAYRGMGIATALLTELEQVAPAGRYELFTSTKSVQNLALYQRLGYRCFKEQPWSGLTLAYLEKKSVGQ